MLWPALKLVLTPVLLAQALETRRRAPVLPEAQGPRAGVVGAARGAWPEHGGRELAGEGPAFGSEACGLPPVRLLIAGDSSAAGVGVDHQDRALAGQLADALHVLSSRAVCWHLVAKSGLTTAGVHALLRDNEWPQADLAVVVSGVNDVIERVPPALAVQHRAALADWLVAERGVRHVVFAALPPVHRFPLLPRPLRDIAGAEARRHDQAMARWAATREDASHVPIELELGLDSMASDGFHPGEPVYRASGRALALHIADRLLPPAPAPTQDPSPRRRRT